MIDGIVYSPYGRSFAAGSRGRARGPPCRTLAINLTASSHHKAVQAAEVYPGRTSFIPMRVDTPCLAGSYKISIHLVIPKRVKIHLPALGEMIKQIAQLELAYGVGEIFNVITVLIIAVINYYFIHLLLFNLLLFEDLILYSNTC